MIAIGDASLMLKPAINFLTEANCQRSISFSIGHFPEPSPKISFPSPPVTFCSTRSSIPPVVPLPMPPVLPHAASVVSSRASSIYSAASEATTADDDDGTADREPDDDDERAPLDSATKPTAAAQQTAPAASACRPYEKRTRPAGADAGSGARSAAPYMPNHRRAQIANLFCHET